jgi:hypothetical protein
MGPARFRSRPAALLTAVTAGAALLALPAATHSEAATVRQQGSPAFPTHDPFYRYSGHLSLKKIKAGTVLKKRSVQVHLSDHETPVQAEQLLYRTIDERRRPSVTVTTVIAPTPAAHVLGVEAYLSFYDALGPECDPSYTLAGGYAGSTANEGQAHLEQTLISADLAQGVAVTIPDFEGERLDWGAGQEAGWSSLDSIKATESYLGSPSGTKVGLSGYSGGSIAAEWAAELQPHYAPQLNVVGTTAGGIPVDLAHNLRYVNGSKSWSGVIPAVTLSVSRAFGVNINRYLSRYGRKIAHRVSTKCIGGFVGQYPHLKIQQLLKPKYRNVFSISAFRHIVNHMIMGSAPGHPSEPMFFAVGDADGTGDGVMVTRDVEALAHEYCRQGVDMRLQVYQGLDHGDTAVSWEPVASAWLLERFEGVAASGNCASIPNGNSLAPVKAPKK